MNNDSIADLKQFIATTIRTEVQTAVDTQVRAVVKEEVRAVVQQEVRAVVKEEVRAVVQQELHPINQKIDDLTDFVRDAIDTSNEATGEQLANHETRITKLEKATA